jgi:hypothetical protein
LSATDQAARHVSYQQRTFAVAGTLKPQLRQTAVAHSSTSQPEVLAGSLGGAWGIEYNNFH